MWWSEDEYKRSDLVPVEMDGFTGPNGLAVVKLHTNGKTDPGWGQDQFMRRYGADMFKPSKTLNYSRYANRPPFAFVMRSLRMVCIDIDGKNGGLEHVGKLGMLPYTLAETSKSGNGYHLFYSTSEDVWDAATGFAEFKDRIGIQQGVDFRATGCVFHWPSQRWNNRKVEELPYHLKDMLKQHRQKEDAAVYTITKTLESEDPEQIALMQDALVDDLQKPIPSGRRNNTLFAVGSQMMLAEVPNWRKLIDTRATEVGLDDEEVVKLLKNIEKYGDSV